MKKQPKKNETVVDIRSDQRDFIKEYEAFFIKLGYDIKSMEFELRQDGGHIKKCSLFEKSPTPVLTNYTF